MRETTTKDTVSYSMLSTRILTLKERGGGEKERERERKREGGRKRGGGEKERE